MSEVRMDPVSDNPPILSAVICTLNHPGYLANSLASLLAQTAEPGSYEVLVVDNGPHVATRGVVDGLSSKAVTVRYVVEPVRGLSRARLTGWRQARGGIVAYLDDDAVADPAWVEATMAAFRAADNRVACVGGPVEITPEGALEPWYPPSLAAGFDLGPDVRGLSGDECLWGCSFAFRRDALEQVAAFTEDLGRKDSNLMANEDVLVQKRLDASGYARAYDPAIRITHPLPAQRLSKSWVRRRSYWQGVSDAVMYR
ncbi:MAG: glycosyltransferase, partial [Actinomycetes bacterium]